MPISESPVVAVKGSGVRVESLLPSLDLFGRWEERRNLQSEREGLIEMVKINEDLRAGWDLFDHVDINSSMKS